MTVLGELVLPSGTPAWTSALVETLQGLGVEEKAARQALARTAAEGFIEVERSGRRASWSLTPSGRALLTDGAERIFSFAASSTGWDGRWLMIAVTVPESQRRLRHRLRTRMNWAGFGNPAPGLWINPNTDREAEAKQILGDF